MQGNGRKTREQLGTTTKTISPASDPSSSPIHRPSGQRRARHGYELSELRDAAVDAAIQIDAANKHDVATSPTREDNKQKSGKAKDVGVMCPTPHVASSQNESSEESETRHTPREDNPPAKQQREFGVTSHATRCDPDPMLPQLGVTPIWCYPRLSVTHDSVLL